MPTCAICGHSLSPGTAFCPACGAPTATRASSAGDESLTQVLTPGAGSVTTPGAPQDASGLPARDASGLPAPDSPASAAEAPTEVLPPVAPSATQVMPRGAMTPPVAPSPPPPASSPGSVPPPGGSRGGDGFWGEPPRRPGGASSGRSRTIWIVVAVVLACVAVAAALWALGVFGDAAEEFVGDWWALDDSGGLVIDDDLTVWVVTPDGDRAGPMPGTLDDDVLTFTLSDAALEMLADGDTSVVIAFRGKVVVSATYDDTSGHLEAETRITGDVGKFAGAIDPSTTTYKRVDTLPTAAPTPTRSATPTVSVSPTPSGSPSPTGSGSPSPSASPSATGNPLDDQQVRDGADLIADAIAAYISANGAAPATGSVVPGGALEPHLPAASWPVNPYTDAPMTEGGGIGDYSYVGSDAGFTLTAHLGDGTDYTLE